MQNQPFDKKHWYDGLFYDKLIAPNQDKLFSEIKNIIEPSSTVVDVGCGTGRLSFQLATHCKTIIGIDLSSKNISVAEHNLRNSFYPNVKFLHGNAIDLQKKINTKYDYAVTTYVIHEMNIDDRVELLKEMKQVANKLILGDYIVPTPQSLMGKINIAVEYFAGKDHYNNFKTFVKDGGLNSLIKSANLKLIKEIKTQPQTAHLVVVE